MNNTDSQKITTSPKEMTNEQLQKILTELKEKTQ